MTSTWSYLGNVNLLTANTDIVVKIDRFIAEMNSEYRELQCAITGFTADDVSVL